MYILSFRYKAFHVKPFNPIQFLTGIGQIFIIMFKKLKRFENLNMYK